MTPRRWLSHPLVSTPISIPLLFPPPLFLPFLLLLIFVSLPLINKEYRLLALFGHPLDSLPPDTIQHLGRVGHIITLEWGFVIDDQMLGATHYI